MNEINQIARELVESYLYKSNKKLNYKHFCMFSVSKFLLLKEVLVKKDSENNILYFDNIKNKKYESAIIEFAKEIKKTAEYKKNNIQIKLTNESERNEELIEALWIFNKVRDSFAHKKYSIDFENGKVVIDNVSTEENNEYKLKCSIPINLLNTITYFVEETNIYDISEKDYENYLKNIYNYYNIDEKRIEKSYIKKFIINKNIGYSKQLIKRTTNKYISIPKENINDEINSYFNLYDNQKLYTIAKMLLNYRPKNEKEKALINNTLKEIKILMSQKIISKVHQITEIKVAKLMKEISTMLNIDENLELVASLYNYMTLTFSDKKEIDYEHLNLNSLTIQFDPLYKGNGIVNQYNNFQNCIKKACNDFINDMESKVDTYKNHPNEYFRHSIMYHFTTFYNTILNYQGKRNEIIITSIRNSIEHGNLYAISGNILLYDQGNHNDLKTIKSLSVSSPETLYNITKTIDQNNAKETYTLNTFFNTLKPLIDKQTLNKVQNIMNEFSIIIFGKELNQIYSMEQMYKESIAVILNKVKEKKLTK